MSLLFLVLAFLPDPWGFLFFFCANERCSDIECMNGDDNTFCKSLNVCRSLSFDSWVQRKFFFFD